MIFISPKHLHWPGIRREVANRCVRVTLCDFLAAQKLVTPKNSIEPNAHFLGQSSVLSRGSLRTGVSCRPGRQVVLETPHLPRTFTAIRCLRMMAGGQQDSEEVGTAEG